MNIAPIAGERLRIEMAKRYITNYERKLTRRGVRRDHAEHTKASTDSVDRRKARAEYRKRRENIAVSSLAECLV